MIRLIPLAILLLTCASATAEVPYQPTGHAQLPAAIAGTGIENDVHIYDDVQHGFWLHVDRDPDTHTGPALAAWQRLKAYFQRALSE